MKYFLDTNICIYLLKNKLPLLIEKILSFDPNEIKIPSIVKAELLYGAEKSQKRNDNIEKINHFLFPLDIVGFGDIESTEYSLIRSNLEKQGKIIGPNDLIIASTVKANNGVLVTNNVKEFNRVEDLVVENWLDQLSTNQTQGT
ncbi:MAG: type II toxin-antitoxin system VapC family toxin [Candidatus Marinimicrobia bacterium]|nr:type II toxin-antitoxin system VapC family toxin [Candidatus Neomarinimicrobiota bacterium]